MSRVWMCHASLTKEPRLTQELFRLCAYTYLHVYVHTSSGEVVVCVYIHVNMCTYSHQIHLTYSCLSAPSESFSSGFGRMGIGVLDQYFFHAGLLGLILLSMPCSVAHLCSTECAYWHADHSSRLHYRTTSGVCWGVACATDVVHSLSFPALPTVISHLAVVNVIAKRWVWKARCVSHKGKTFAVYYKDTDALVCGIFCHKHFLQFQGLLWYFVIWVSYNAGSRTDLETKFERYFLESFFRERNYSFLGQ